MRSSAALLLFCTIAAAQQQIPILDQVKGWVNKATARASSAAASINTPSPPDPVSAGAAALSSIQVEKLTLDNFKSTLTHRAATASPGIEEWMIYVTGGNKTCYGRCERAEEQWNKSVSILAASESPPNLALLDCEANPVLCHAWSVGPPSIYHIQLPKPAADQSQAPTTVRFITFNRTTITADEIAAIHTEEKYKATEPYEGIFHPFDGPLAKTGTNVYVGYAVWAFSLVPSWLFMVGVSMISRNIMSRRMTNQNTGGGPTGGGRAAPRAAAT